MTFKIAVLLLNQVVVGFGDWNFDPIYRLKNTNPQNKTHPTHISKFMLNFTAKIQSRKLSFVKAGATLSREARKTDDSFFS